MHAALSVPVRSSRRPRAYFVSFSMSRMIELEYSALNQSKYRDFNATLLNETASLVNVTLTNGTITAPNYLFATLIAANATGGPGDNGGSSMPPSDQGAGGSPDASSGAKSSLAMIILYAITGCVSALFCVVIVSGVRFFRPWHPVAVRPFQHLQLNMYTGYTCNPTSRTIWSPRNWLRCRRLCDRPWTAAESCTGPDTSHFGHVSHRQVRSKQP